MAMIYQALELADRRGHWRVVGASDESRGVYDECCDCDGGHSSPDEARACPKAKAKLDKRFHRDAESLKAKVASLKERLTDAEEELSRKETEL